MATLSIGKVMASSESVINGIHLKCSAVSLLSATCSGKKSKAIETLQQMQPELAQNLQGFLQFYWGGIGFTAGPPYIGIVICLLAFIGFSNNNNPHRVWIGLTIILSCLLAAGSYLKDFNVFFLDHVPFYNKFRAPSMIMVIPTLLMGIMALYGADALSKETSLSNFTKKYKIGLGLIMVVFSSFNKTFRF